METSIWVILLVHPIAGHDCHGIQWWNWLDVHILSHDGSIFSMGFNHGHHMPTAVHIQVVLVCFSLLIDGLKLCNPTPIKKRSQQVKTDPNSSWDQALSTRFPSGCFPVIVPFVSKLGGKCPVQIPPLRVCRVCVSQVLWFQLWDLT